MSRGAPGAEVLQGLMVTDLKSYLEQPYVPFAPAAGEGEATNRDTNVTATWEKQQDFSGGVGRFIERKAEDNGYAYSFANTAANGKTGATLFTFMPGCLMPPASLGTAGTVTNALQFCEFSTKYYFVTSDSTRKLYVYDSDGDTPSEVTLPSSPADQVGTAKQLYTDGATLYITQGASKNIIKSTDGTTWAAYQVSNTNVNADFVCMRDDGALAYVAGATLTPGAGIAGSQSYSATTIGWSGTTATGMIFYKGSLWIGKPEGLYSWYEGKVDERVVTGENYSTSNFTKMCVHHSLLYFNVKNHLFFTDGTNFTEVFPNDAGGFANISCIFPTSGGPLILGGKLLTQSQGQSAYYFPTAAADNDTIGGVAWTNPTNVYTSNNVYATADLSASSDGPHAFATIVDAPLSVVEWTNPTNAGTSDNNRAEAVMGGVMTHYLKCTNASFAIPANSTIVGIAVSVEARASDPTILPRLNAHLVKGDTIDPSYKIDGYGQVISSASDATYTFGNSKNLWGASLEAADVNGATFGVALFVQIPIGTSCTIGIDYVTMTVYYHPKSHYLALTDFDISLPTNAVPVGIMVDVETEWGYCELMSAKLIKGGVIGGDEKAWHPSFIFEPGGETPRTMPAGTELHASFGAKNSLWGNTLTRTDVVASDFGVAICAYASTGTVRIDAARISVFYTLMDTSLEQLFLFAGPDAPGLNPIWSDDDGTHQTVAAGVTSLYDSTGVRIYFCCNDAVNAAKIKYFSMTPRYIPSTFRTDTAWNYASYIELTEFSAGYRTVPKWWYQVVLNVRDPIATTYAKVDYCNDGGAWTECVDENGNPAILSLGERTAGCFIPLAVTGTYIVLRIYLWTTSASQVAKVTHVTLRGLTKPKIRKQFTFPVDCSERVKPLKGQEESGEAVRDFLYTAAEQGYPCKFQDLWGDWYLTAFREPGPQSAIQSYKPPESDAPLRLFTVVHCVLMEIDPLSSEAEREAWEPG